MLDFEKIEDLKPGEEVPVLDSIVVVGQEEKHDSGFRFLNIYGIKGNLSDPVWCKRLSDCADVIHFTLNKKSVKKYCDIDSDSPVINVDCLAPNVFRYFGGNLRVDVGISDFWVKVER